MIYYIKYKYMRALKRNFKRLPMLFWVWPVWALPRAKINRVQKKAKSTCWVLKGRGGGSPLGTCFFFFPSQINEFPPCKRADLFGFSCFCFRGAFKPAQPTQSAGRTITAQPGTLAPLDENLKKNEISPKGF